MHPRSNPQQISASSQSQRLRFITNALKSSRGLPNVAFGSAYAMMLMSGNDFASRGSNSTVAMFLLLAGIVGSSSLEAYYVRRFGWVSKSSNPSQVQLANLTYWQFLGWTLIIVGFCVGLISLCEIYAPDTISRFPFICGVFGLFANFLPFTKGRRRELLLFSVLALVVSCLPLLVHMDAHSHRAWQILARGFPAIYVVVDGLITHIRLVWLMPAPPEVEIEALSDSIGSESPLEK